MSELVVTFSQRFGATSRRDRWWATPLTVFLALSAFIAYATWAGFQNAHYHFGPYLSPMYSPELFGSSPHSWFGPKPAWWPAALPFSPTFLIIGGPLGFRLTCYYYRGAYYKAFWADPPSCGVGEPRSKYLGEQWFPLIIQNIHRYFLYIALVINVILAYDAIVAYRFPDPTGTRFGVGVGSLVLTVNAILLAIYSLSCHSLRHLIGGCRDCVSTAPGGGAPYRCVTALNKRHMLFAWVSLVWVAFTDIYVRLCSTGIWSDFRIL
jgi:hypothetical protein